MFRKSAAAFGVAAALVATGAQAAFPEKPIRLIVPFGAGGITDIVARHVGQAWSQSLGGNVIVENRPGAGGVIAAQAGATAAPDGYTVFMGTVGTQVVNPLIMPKPGYDPQRAFRPIGLVSAAPYVLAARSSLGVKTYAQLVDYARANPGKLNFGSAGNASSPHLGLELLKLRESLDILHIPFKSGGEAVNAAVGGQVDLVMDAVPVVMPHVQSGKLNALMLASSTPVQGAEQVPTTQQLGKPDLNIASWAAFYVPAGTPDAVVGKLNEALKQALSSHELRSRVAAQGIQLYSGELAEHDAFLAGERKRWAEIVKRANITLN
ncbi:lipoprotein [Bordetella ansorpii]|uniref:Lipoprotein n=1 Tax=Bordetella ansorpii TaxID=288768 RepID=A0A157SWC3_9BORD|nr:tripartite tricarboxylate transporter substrate binding protein [Bordetella ansorpii]SAI74729.1 lipoprotein [Bordetella ansorpii]